MSKRGLQNSKVFLFFLHFFTRSLLILFFSRFMHHFVSKIGSIHFQLLPAADDPILTHYKRLPDLTGSLCSLYDRHPGIFLTVPAAYICKITIFFRQCPSGSIRIWCLSAALSVPRTYRSPINLRIHMDAHR